MARLRDEQGSAVAEFTMVVGLLTLLTLAVLQLGLALHVRNTVADAASEGARFAALADNGLADGAERPRQLIAVALGPAYTGDITATLGEYLGHPSAVITVRAPLPILGLFGPAKTMEVSGHAAVETLEE